jgi:phospho-N-acetylmuramoyl-pentapeptide-transferase
VQTVHCRRRVTRHGPRTSSRLRVLRLLFWLGTHLEPFFGPFRLLTSHLFLGGLSVVLSWLGTFVLLPRLMDRVGRDRGREFAIQAEASKGKPTGTGVIFISVFVVVQLLCLPLTLQSSVILLLTLGAMLFGYLDDRAMLPWGEYKKGLLDLVLAVAAAAVLSGGSDVPMWLPFYKAQVIVPMWLFIAGGAVLIWVAINATNCTDGVDGLSGSLTAIAFTALGTLMYFILGHKEIADYLLLPHVRDGAVWGMIAFALVGTLMAYLWYNAHPSILLMGDAGSRALGFLLGVFVIKTGNPFMILVVSGVLLVNGGTGLLKVALLRFAKIRILQDIRFPLHDHVRHTGKWSNPQVLVRFTVLQVMLAMVLLLLMIKIR